MKLKNKLKFTTDYVLKNVFQNFIIIILLVLCFIMFSLSIMYFQTIRFCRESTEDVLADGIERTYVLRISDEQYSTESAKDFRKALYETESINSIGDFSYGGNDSRCFQELKDRQRGHMLESGYEVLNSLEIFYASKEIMPLCELKLYAGEEMSHQVTSDEKNLCYILGMRTEI